jgi:hypothetical protein
MRHKQGLDFHRRVVTAEHPEALPCPATLPQMTFPHWVVGLRLHSNNNLHNSNSKRSRDNSSFNRHRMTTTHLGWVAFLGINNTNNSNPVCSISVPERSRVSNQQKPKSSGCVTRIFTRDVLSWSS